MANIGNPIRRFTVVPVNNPVVQPDYEPQAKPPPQKVEPKPVPQREHEPT